MEGGERVIIEDDYLVSTTDAYAYVISANIHRRHLTAEDKRKLIADVLKAKPELSDRQIAEQVKDDHKKVGRVRKKMEATGSLPQLEKTRGKDGKERPARRKPAEVAFAAPCDRRKRVFVQDDPQEASADRAEARCAAQWKKFTAQELAAEEMPTEAEAHESWQNDLYDQACLFVERMDDETRRRFFAKLATKYDDDIPEFLRRVAVSHIVIVRRPPLVATGFCEL